MVSSISLSDWDIPDGRLIGCLCGGGINLGCCPLIGIGPPGGGNGGLPGGNPLCAVEPDDFLFLRLNHAT